MTAGTGGLSESGTAVGGDANRPAAFVQNNMQKRASDSGTAGGNAYSGATSNASGGVLANDAGDQGTVDNTAARAYDQTSRYFRVSDRDKQRMVVLGAHPSLVTLKAVKATISGLAVTLTRELRASQTVVLYSTSVVQLITLLRVSNLL